MSQKIIVLVFSLFTAVFFSYMKQNPQQKEKTTASKEQKDKVQKGTTDKKNDKAKIIEQTEKALVVNPILDSIKPLIPLNEQDSLELFLKSGKLKFLKKKAHASYYHNRFNGRKTASGKRFNNNKYTAAHKKLPFGTKVKVTNEANGKFVIVEITDRGPFSKAREIDLSRKAFMELVENKNTGVCIVTIEVIETKK
jgi:rare lipoprotein A